MDDVKGVEVADTVGNLGGGREEREVGGGGEIRREDGEEVG